MVNTTRDATPNLDAALLDAQRAMPSLARDSRNTHGGYDYTSSESVIDAGRKALQDAGLTLTRRSWKIHTGDKPSAEVDSFFGIITTQYVLTHAASGEERVYEYDFPILPRKGWPPDKTVLAGLTTTLNYVYRDLLQIPRKLGKDLDDRREDRDEGPEQQRQTRPDTLGVEYARAMQARITKIGKTIEGLATALFEAKAVRHELPKEMDKWPAFLAKRIDAMIAKAEHAAAQDTDAKPDPKPAPRAKAPAKPVEQQRAAESEQESDAQQEREESKPPPATEDKRPTRTPWTSDKPPQGTHPLFWRTRMVTLAKSAMSAHQDALKGWTAEALVENAEHQWKLPTPDDASPLAAVALYKQAHDKMAGLDRNGWNDLTIPF